MYDADAGRGAAPTASSRDRYLAENQRLGEQGLRVLATGAQGLRPGRPSTPTVTCCRWSTAWSCWPWSGSSTRHGPAAKASIATARAAGIRVRMITGDHAVTAAAIAAQLGIEGTVMTGAEFAAHDRRRGAAARSTTSG